MAKRELATRANSVPMVGLAKQTWDPEFNEEHNRAPRDVCNEGNHCGHCNEEVLHSNMQVLRDSKPTCLACYNLKYREVEALYKKRPQQDAAPTFVCSGVCTGNVAVEPRSDKANREGF